MKSQQNNPQTQLTIDTQLHEYIVLTQRLLTDLIQELGSQCQSQFNSSEIPSISIQAYLRRIHKFTHYSSESLMIAIVYIDRYNIANEEFSLNWHNVHRLLLTCLLLATKFHDDVYFDNATFEKGGGVSKEALFKLEKEVFQAMGFNGYVDEEDYQALVDKLYSVYGEGSEQSGQATKDDDQ